MTPWVLRLFIANVAMFFVQRTIPGLDLVLGLQPARLLTQPWTPITYMFLHGGLTHLLFNMLGLYFFGPRLEERLGSRHFLGLYFTSGLTGALLSFFTMPGALVIGASGAIYGIMLAFARYWPREQLLLWGILPVQARVLVLGLAVLSLVLGRQGGGNIAHFAHLGGFLGAFVYLKVMEAMSPARRFRARVERAGRASLTPGAELKRWEGINRDGLHALNIEEVDRLLAKVRSHGPGSLSTEERAFLERLASR